MITRFITRHSAVFCLIWSIHWLRFRGLYPVWTLSCEHYHYCDQCWHLHRTFIPPSISTYLNAIIKFIHYCHCGSYMHRVQMKGDRDDERGHTTEKMRMSVCRWVWVTLLLWSCWEWSTIIYVSLQNNKIPNELFNRLVYCDKFHISFVCIRITWAKAHIFTQQKHLQQRKLHVTPLELKFQFIRSTTIKWIKIGWNDIIFRVVFDFTANSTWQNILSFI